MKPIISDTILREAVMQELEFDPKVAAKHISVTAIDKIVGLAPATVVRVRSAHSRSSATSRLALDRPAAAAAAARSSSASRSEAHPDRRSRQSPTLPARLRGNGTSLLTVRIGVDPD